MHPKDDDVVDRLLPVAVDVHGVVPLGATLMTSLSVALVDGAFVELPEYLATIACVPAASRLVVHLALAVRLKRHSGTASQPAMDPPSAVN